MDLFTASTGTNSVTLEWAMLLLLLYPECGRRARQELDAVVGPGRLVTLEDRPNLPYTQALLAETLRRSSVLALAVPHRAETDMEIAGTEESGKREIRRISVTWRIVKSCYQARYGYRGFLLLCEHVCIRVPM